MSDSQSPIVRLVAASEIPVRIPDWPEDVGIAICRVHGRTLSLQPYHAGENAAGLKRRLLQEVGDALLGFAIHPPMKGLAAAQIGPADENRMLADLEQALRSSPRLVEEVSDFAINFEFAAEEGLSLDGLQDLNRRKDETPGKVADQLPVGYQAFVKADPNCEVISGAVLRPAGAAGIDLLLVPEKSLPLRDIPAEAAVLVREDSLRVAVPLAPVLVNGQLPKSMRLPAGALMLGQSGGKPVPALVLRRGGFLFVAPDYAAVSQPVTAAPVAKRSLPWKWIGLGVAGVALVVAVAVAVTMITLMPGETNDTGPVAPVQGLRDNLFAPRSN